MPNKRNKNRDKIAVTLSQDKREEINEYLAKQHSIKDTVELALLLAKKTFGMRDLEGAYQDYALSITPGPILNQDLSSQKTVSRVETGEVKNNSSNNHKSKQFKSEQLKSEKKPINNKAIKPKITKKNKVSKEANKKENNSSNKLDPKAINQLFDNGNMSDL